jgi:hypothetical protein
MATYHVGPQGASVFDEHGRVVGVLRPGDVVVPGTLESAGSPADRYRDEHRPSARYDDKVVRPSRGPAA